MQLPDLSPNVTYPQGIVLLDHYLRKRHANGDLELPDFTTGSEETVAIFSDYAGDDNSSTHTTYSFLLVGYNTTSRLAEALGEIRERHGMRTPPREVALKELHYGPMRRMLPEYLEALDSYLSGWLVTIAVEKRVNGLFGVDPASLVTILNNAGVGGWKPASAERMLRITHFAAYLAAVAVPDGHKIFWMTDNDDIVPNPRMGDHAMKVFESLLPEYTRKTVPLIGWATPFEDRSDMLHHDLLSGPDLAAGVFAAYCTTLSSEGERSPKGEWLPVHEWLRRRDTGLRKTMLRIHEADSAHLTVTGFF